MKMQVNEMDYKKHIAEKIKVEGVSEQEIYDSIALPPNTEMGDFALPCFKFAKTLRKSPVMIAEELKNAIATDNVISEVSALNGYLNFKIDKNGFVKGTLDKIKKDIPFVRDRMYVALTHPERYNLFDKFKEDIDKF